jgi:prepilin-type N-terminal cleavage/methylation domain-containing protein
MHFFINKAACVVPKTHVKPGQAYSDQGLAARGFTVTELVFVIIILGVLAAVVIPKLLRLDASAHKSIVAATAKTFESARSLVNLRYRMLGYRGVRDNIPGFGAGNVDTNAAGYPTDTSNVNSISGSAARCTRVWNGIMLNPPSIGTAANTTADYRATAAGEICTFTYRKDTSTTRRFRYNALTGAVVITNP